MISIAQIAAFDLVVGTIAALGLIYLLYSDLFVVHYRRFFRLIMIGLLIYALTGPIIGTYAPRYIHAVHGVATLFITLGLFDLVNEHPHRDLDLAELLLSNPVDRESHPPEDVPLEQ